MFLKNLHFILQFEKKKIDEKRVEIKKIQEKIDFFSQEIENKKKEMKEQYMVVCNAPDTGKSYQSYVKASTDFIENCRKEISCLEKKEKEEIDALKDMFRKMKSYEEIRDKKIEENKLEQKRKEQEWLDEIALRKK